MAAHAGETGARVMIAPPPLGRDERAVAAETRRVRSRAVSGGRGEDVFPVGRREMGGRSSVT